MSKLTFAALREANTLRVPQFKNKHGQLAHSEPDGSDWTPAQWLQAMVGELGEFAEVRMRFELGQLTPEAYAVAAAKELADVAIYQDILARRALDVTAAHPGDAASTLMGIVFNLGIYANARKKFDRGDICALELSRVAERHFPFIRALLDKIEHGEVANSMRVRAAHPSGVDLGQAVEDKFNEVSRRVGAPVWLHGDQVSIDE